jgi:hypothetical protein
MQLFLLMGYFLQKMTLFSKNNIYRVSLSDKNE